MGGSLMAVEKQIVPLTRADVTEILRCEVGSLPADPDYAAVNAFLIDAYERTWSA